MKYESKRNYILFDYNMSHSQLVLRSFKKDDSDSNLDIIFFGVNQIKIGTNFDSVNIEWDRGYKEDDIEFTINDGKISCSFFNVIENKFDFGETSVFKELNQDCKLIYSSNDDYT